MNQGSCFTCKKEFASYNSLYYCCTEGQLVCILCNDKLCDHCGNKRKQQLEKTICFACRERVVQTCVFFQFRNQKDYCSLCVKKAYEKNRSNPDIFYIHETRLEKYQSDKAQVESYLKSTCWQCLGKLTKAEEKQNQTQQIQKIKCQNCKVKPTKQESPKKSTFSTSSFSSYRKCDACGFTIYENSGFITQDFAVCQSCARFSSYEQEKIVSSKIQPQSQEDEEWTRRDDDYWHSMKREQIQMVENQPQEIQSPADIKFTKIEQKNFKSNKQVRKDDSFQLHQSLKLDIEDEDKTLQCTECSYEISKDNLVENICRCCHVARRDEQEKKQKAKKYQNIFGVKKEEENKQNELKQEKDKKCKICSQKFVLFEEGVCVECKTRSTMQLTTESYW